MVRVDHSQAFGTFRPVHSTPSRGLDLGRKEGGKLVLETVGHFGAQATLNVIGAHVLRRLIETQERGGKIHGPLGATRSGDIRTVTATNAHLSQFNSLVAATNATRQVILRSFKDLNLSPEQRLERAKNERIRRIGKHHGQATGCRRGLQSRTGHPSHETRRRGWCDHGECSRRQAGHGPGFRNGHSPKMQ
jgi:hypothetical protein